MKEIKLCYESQVVNNRLGLFAHNYIMRDFVNKNVTQKQCY